MPRLASNLHYLACTSGRQKATHLLTAQVQTTGWEVTLERQKLRAEALVNEFGALVEFAARKVLGIFFWLLT